MGFNSAFKGLNPALYEAYINTYALKSNEW